MNNILIKKSSENTLDEYIRCITSNSEKKIPLVKKQIKLTQENPIIITTQNYDDISKYNLNISQLKSLAKNYKLKISGNKNQLINRIYAYLYLSSFIIKIQKIFRGMIVKKYKNLHGPAAMNRKLCNNPYDFITMEPLEEINFHQFLSYKDTDGFIYGFDIISLYNLFLKSKDIDSVLNPYNRNIIPSPVIKTIKSVIRLSKIINIHIDLHFDDNIKNITNEKSIELRALSLFQSIDALGNYSNSEWFMSLNRYQLIKFIRELSDIWNYRAQLTNEIKHNICPPNGNPFRNLSMPYINTETNIHNIRKVIIEVLEKIVNSGIDNDCKALGAYYVLGALTIVNETAATSLPWLFQSFSYI
jgi:hypothetical protein